MAEPSDFQKGIIEEATYLRGLVLRSYSQIEFVLADISVKLDLKFPYLLSKRIAAVRRIAERPGYESYRNELSKVCDELLEYDELRNFMAHAYMMVTFDKAGNHAFEFRMYERKGEGGFQLQIVTTNLSRLKTAAAQVTTYVEHAINLFKKIYFEQRIEDPKDGILTEPKEKPA